MKIVFFGSSEFAVPVLEALRPKEEVVLVVTQPDRKKGRGLRPAPTPVKKTADGLGIKSYQTTDVNSGGSIEYIEKLDPDLFIVVSFGQILSPEALAVPKKYCLNVHASLLPKYRGAAPINWAIANGEKETGITIIKMNEKMDEGEVLLKDSIPIDDEDAISLSLKLSHKGAQLLLNSIELVRSGKANFIKQPESDASFAPKLKKQDGLIHWKWSTEKIYNRIRAFVPWPGCFTYWNKKLLKIWKAEKAALSSKPGTVLDVSGSGIVVATGDSALRIRELQIEAKRRMNVGEFIAGHRDMTPGAKFTL